MYRPVIRGGNDPDKREFGEVSWRKAVSLLAVEALLSALPGGSRDERGVFNLGPGASR